MRLITNLKKWSPRVKNAALAMLFLTAYTVSAVGPFVPVARAAAGDMSVGTFEGQNSDGSWSPGNNTQFAEGDYVNYRFPVTAAANGNSGVLYVKYSTCMFTNYFALLGSPAPAVVTPGAQSSSGGDWSQKLTIAFPTAGTATVQFTLRISNTGGDCNGSSSHVALDTLQQDKGDFGNIGSKDIPIPANSIFYSPSLTIAKIVDGGTAVASDFWFTVSPAVNGQAELHIPVGQTSVTITDVNPDGVFVITEHGPAGYTFTGGTGTNCTTTATGVMTATVTSGRPAINATCTFTNAIQKGSITIVKDAVPNGPQDFAFTTTGTGLSAFSLDDDSDPTLSNTKTFSQLLPGSYSVTETPTTGWDLGSLTCTGGGTQVNGATVSITLAPGANVSCTYTNRQHGQIIVNKVTNPANDQTAFSVTATGNAAIVGSATRSLTTSSPVTYEVSQGTYSVNETVPAGWAQTANTCSNLVINGNTPLVNGIPTLSCTITNTKLAKLKIVKDAVPNDPQDFSFTTTGTGLSTFSLDDDSDATLANSKEFVELAPGTYTVTEASIGGWSLTGLSCDTNNFSVSGAQVSVALTAGQVTTCTYTNTKLGSLSGTKYEVNADGSTVKVEPSGWLITLFESGVSTGLTQTTDGSGNYTFTGLLPGTYSVTESPLSGWTQIYSPLSPVSLSAGQVVEDQDFGNFKNGSISGYKFNDYDGNGYEDQGDEYLSGWTITLRDANNNVVTQPGLENPTVTNEDGYYGFTNLAPGTYWVCETGQSGWVQTYPGDNACNQVLIDKSGEEKEAVKFGNQGQGTLTVKKNVDSNGDGTVDYYNVDNWTWDLDGLKDYSNVATGGSKTVGAGEYTIHEDQKDNYHFTQVICTGTNAKYSQAESIAITVEAGANVVCTYTNTRDTGFVKVVKELYPEDDEGLFDLSVDESVEKEDASDGDDTGWVRVVTGEHTLSEVAGSDTDMAHYDSRYYCWDDWELSNQSTDFDWVTGDGTSVDVPVAKGQYIVCSFYNERHAELTIVKDAQPNDAQDFEFTLTPLYRDDVRAAQSPLAKDTVDFSALETSSEGEMFDGSFWLDDDADETLSNSQAFEVSGGRYKVAETPVEGWDLTGIECSGVFPGQEEEYLDAESEYEWWYVDKETGELYMWVNPGSQVTCTFTNTKRATVTITKDAQPNFAQPFTFTTNLGGDEETSFSLTDDGVNGALASRTFSGVVPGVYSVSEAVVNGWTLNGATCTGAEITREGSTVTMEVVPGADVKCTFVNQKNTIPQVLGAVDPPKLENTGGSVWVAVSMSLTVMGLAVLTALSDRRRNQTMAV